MEHPKYKGNYGNKCRVLKKVVSSIGFKFWYRANVQDLLLLFTRNSPSYTSLSVKQNGLSDKNVSQKFSHFCQGYTGIYWKISIEHSALIGCFSFCLAFMNKWFIRLDLLLKCEKQEKMNIHLKKKTKFEKNTIQNQYQNLFW